MINLPISNVPKIKNSAILNCINLFLTHKNNPAIQINIIASDEAIIDKDAHAIA
jgi:hypothetical protein